MRKTAILWITLVVVIVVIQNASAYSYFGLWADEARNFAAVNTYEDYELIEIWVWVNPDDEGGICAEYKLDFPENILPVSTTFNPLHSVALGQAFGAPGISICFANCQTDWFWTTKIEALVVNRDPQILTPASHDDQAYTAIATCEPGYPIEEMQMLGSLYINTCRHPEVIGVEVTGPSTIRAHFDREVLKGQVEVYYFSVTPDNVKIYEKGNTSNEIEVISVEKVESEDNVLDITVDGFVDSDKNYILATYELCTMAYCGYISPIPRCGDSEFEIPGTISVEESSWGAIKGLYK